MILATVYAFLERHGLLHLFPAASAPTIPECPSWRDPLSDEGIAAMALLAAGMTSAVLSSSSSAPPSAVLASGSSVSSPLYASQGSSQDQPHAIAKNNYLASGGGEQEVYLAGILPVPAHSLSSYSPPYYPISQRVEGFESGDHDDE